MEGEKLCIEKPEGYGSIETDAAGHSKASTGVDLHGKSKIKRLYYRMFPLGLKHDAKAILQLTWPLTVCQLMIFLLGPISLVLAGHLGTLELASVALGLSVLNVTGISVMIGLATVCDTLLSAAYGSVNKTLVGVYTQTALYTLPLFCLPCWSLHINAKNILTLLGQDPKVAEMAEQYLIVFIPGLFFCSLHQVVLKYLVNQNIVIPNVIVGIIGNVANIGLQYAFVFQLEWGILGCAAGQACGFFILFAGTLFYIITWKVYRGTWAGWSWKALEDWGLFFRLAIAGLVMTVMEWWTFEFGIFMSGILSNVYLSANSLVFNMENLFYTVPMSFGVAASVRVGQSLGAGDAEGAKNAAHVSQFLAFVGFSFEALIILALRNYLPYIFTNDTIVAEMVSGILILLMIELGLDAITAVACGILRGVGRQRIGALCNLFGFFLVALPLAYVFMFVLGYGAYGFWYGLIVGVLPVCVVYMVLTARIDWNKEVIKAAGRVDRNEVSKSVALDVKSGEFQLRGQTMTTWNKGKLLAQRLLVVLGFAMMLGAGLVARFLTQSDSAFSPSNSTRVIDSPLLTTPIYN